MESPALISSIDFFEFDPEQLVEIVRGAHFDHYVLSKSNCSLTHQRWEWEGFSLDIGLFSFPVRVVGTFPRERICIGYMRDAPEPAFMNGFKIGMETLQFFPAGCELSYRATSSGHWVALEMTEAELQSAAFESTGQTLDLPREHAFSFGIPRPEKAILDGLVRRFERHPNPGEMKKAILCSLASLLADRQTGMPAEVRRSWRLREHVVDEADRYLRANRGAHFRAKSLAVAVGTTERSLQRYFLDSYGMTPAQWARCIALHDARNRLRRPESARYTVEGIANGCGFRHMGRFSAYYKGLFGEFPSETLSKSCILS